MNSRERLKAMVEGRRVDRIGLSGWVHMPMVDTNPKDFARALINFTDYNEWDFIKVMSNGHYMAEAYGAEIDFSKDPHEWSGRFIRYPVNNPKEYENLKVLDPNKGVLAREVELVKRLADHYKGEKPIIATIFTPLTWLQEMTASTMPGPTQAAMKYNAKEVHIGLSRLVETNKLFLDELIKAGIDGIFYATQYATRDVITQEQHEEFARPYDIELLDYIKDRTWFNMLHIHYNKNLMFEELADYPVQAINWEDKGAADNERTSLTQARSITDKILIGGIDQHHDFYSKLNDREEIKSVLKERLLSSLAECPDKRFIFAPGCSLPMDVDRYVFTLMKEVVDEVCERR